MARATVDELRVVLTVDDWDAAMRLYGEALGMEELPSVSSPRGRVAILDSGRATLELADSAHAAYIDEVEVGERVAGNVRIALRVADVDEMSARVAALGHRRFAAATPTPFGSTNVRFDGPGEVQLTLFQPEGAGSPPDDVTMEETLLGSEDEMFLLEAVELATANASTGQLPFGAVVVGDGEVLASGVNTALRNRDPTAHAEVVALRAACRMLNTLDLSGVTVYSSCEPCAMCLTASSITGVGRIVYAASRDMVPDLGTSSPNDQVMTEMQDLLRPNGSYEVQHVPVEGSHLPFDSFLSGS